MTDDDVRPPAEGTQPIGDPFLAPVPTGGSAPSPWMLPSASATPTAAQGTWQAQQAPRAAWPAQQPWGAPPQPQPLVRGRSTVGLIGLILGIIAIVVSFLGSYALLAWLFLIPAVVLGIVGLARRQDRNGLPLAALLTGIAAAVISVVVFAFAFAQELGDILESGGLWPEGARGAYDQDGERGIGSVDAPISAGESFYYDSSWSGEDATVWEITVDGYASLRGTETMTPGRCIAIVGTLTPTHVIAGDELSAWYDIPDMSVMVDGEEQFGYDSCDLDGIEAAGYGFLWDAELAEGESYAFYYDLWIPAEYTGEIDVIVVGDSLSEGAAFIEATELPEAVR